MAATERGETLGDAGIGHLQRRGGGERAFQHAHDQAVVVELGEQAGGRTGGVEFGVGAARLWRRADDGGADEGAAGRADHVGDIEHGIRADRVAFHVNRLLVGGGEHGSKPFGQGERVARRHDGEQEVGFGQLRIGHRGHAGGIGAGRARRAAAGERGQHFDLVFGQAGAHRAAHIARRDDGDGGCHALSPVVPDCYPDTTLSGSRHKITLIICQPIVSMTHRRM